MVIVVMAFVLILVLCVIKVKKLKVDAGKSGMHKYKVLKIIHVCNIAGVIFTVWSNAM